MDLAVRQFIQMASTDAYVRARGLQRLPAALLSHTFSFLPPNERTLTARFICRDASAALSDAEAHTASLSQPLPPHDAPWSVEVGQQYLWQLPFQRKLRLVSTAAASGSEVNLEVAMALLLPSVFPELLQDIEYDVGRRFSGADAAVTAIAAGHPQLLSWLLHHCPALVHPPRAMEAAAQHLDLAGLQAVWEQLQGARFSSCSQDSGVRPVPNFAVMNAAARSATPDAVAKVEWILAESGGRCGLGASTAAAAARSGDLGRLRWLRDRGCLMAEETWWLLPNVMFDADLAAVEWLVDEAGCSLLEPPEGQDEEWYWGLLVNAAAYSSDGVSRVMWLQQRGVPILQASRILLETFTHLSITVGRVQVLRFLQRTYGLGAGPGFPSEQIITTGAAQSGSIPLVDELLQDGLEFGPTAYISASGCGDLTMITWLAREAKVPADHVSLQDLIERWPMSTAAHGRDLLQAVQLLVGEAGCREWDPVGALYAAASRGDLALAQYRQLLHDQQPPPPQRQAGHLTIREALHAAASAGCEALLEWLVEQHAGWLAQAAWCYEYALTNTPLWATSARWKRYGGWACRGARGAR